MSDLNDSSLAGKETRTLRAEQALVHSKNQLIMADTLRGVVTIHRKVTTRSTYAEIFELRFVPRDPKGEFNSEETIVVGLYDDLDIAVTIAAIGYGVGETQWAACGTTPIAPRGQRSPKRGYLWNNGGLSKKSA